MKLVTVVGARPQFVKCAAVSEALARLKICVDEVVVHTGQHYDVNMSDVFFRDLGLPPPAYNLGVRSGTHGSQTGEMLRGTERVLLAERPDAVVVYGDTNSTLAGALAAAKLCIPLVHVEAGMRSFNRCAPEELNRVVTDHLASVLLCPTQTAVRNLAAEGIVAGVSLVGNVMYDALLAHVGRAETTSSILRRLELKPGRYGLVTVHRAENTDDLARLQSIVVALAELSTAHPVVWPVHPRTRPVLRRLSAQIGADGYLDGRSLRFLEPVSYLDMLVLEKYARVILTDSGGVTTEAFWLSVPCVTLREETEWPETVASGWNHLAGADARRIVAAALSAVRPAAAAEVERPGASTRVAAALITLAGRLPAHAHATGVAR